MAYESFSLLIGSKGQGLAGQEQAFAEQMEENESKVKCLLKHLPPKVKDFTWEIQNEFSKSLNPRKESGRDWRTVASRLGFSKLIPRLEKMENPTIELFGECTETTTKMLLGILVDIKRSDVLDDILKVHYPKSLAKFSTQESLKGGDSCASSLSWPSEHSENESSLDETGASRGRLDPQECQEVEEDFLSDQSEKFWVNIPGDYEQKKLTHFVQAAKNQCPKEMQQGNVEKFLCRIWKIDYGQLDINDSYVTLNSFLELVARFGPFKPGPDGCLQKMYDLMTNSLSKRQGKKESWFAGNMDETEAANLLSDQSPGHFLIRISSSRPHEGVFVLAVKTGDNGVVQIQIERDLQDNTLLLADQKFPDLMSIVEALRDDVLLENCSQLLTNPCPGLPLNALFTGYEKATGRRGGR
ncbi:uncharacterized protein LOC122964242 [Acropora millepora]|uniref:uncharacterized protein LOC122964242 n=1 Tax=Acropora millepora TaxID=45264 RepID=UPI001CF3D6A0|nr:uncharacterized protein LOC122964242 [Acropora millepora]